MGLSWDDAKAFSEKDYLKQYRELAKVTLEIMSALKDPRYVPVLAALEDADRAYAANDWTLFCEHVRRVKDLVSVPPPVEPSQLTLIG